MLHGRKAQLGLTGLDDIASGKLPPSGTKVDAA